jgi:hypothetical protein
VSDLRLGFRDLIAAPIATLTAIVSLALDIGGNAALFSLIDSLVLRSLPVADPQRLTVVSGGIPTFPFVPQLPGYTYGIWTALSGRAEPFDGVCAWRFPNPRSSAAGAVDGKGNGRSPNASASDS